MSEPAEGGDLAFSGAQDAVIDATGLGGASPTSVVSEGVGGLVLMLATRGKTIILRPGTTLEIQLNAALLLSRSGGKSMSAHGGLPCPPRVTVWYKEHTNSCVPCRKLRRGEHLLGDPALV